MSMHSKVIMIRKPDLFSSGGGVAILPDILSGGNWDKLTQLIYL